MHTWQYMYNTKVILSSGIKNVKKNIFFLNKNITRLKTSLGSSRLIQSIVNLFFQTFVTTDKFVKSHPSFSQALKLK